MIQNMDVQSRSISYGANRSRSKDHGSYNPNNNADSQNFEKLLSSVVIVIMYMILVYQHFYLVSSVLFTYALGFHKYLATEEPIC